MTTPIHPSRSPYWSMDQAENNHQHVVLSGKAALKQLPEVFERLRCPVSSPQVITKLRVSQLGLTRKQSVGLFAQLGAILSCNQTLQALELDGITGEKQSSSDALCVLLGELCRNGTLRFLRIRERTHAFSSALVRQIAGLLTCSGSLLELDISECLLVSSQRELLQQALRTNFTLQRLVLPDQLKNEDAFCEITSMLSQNRILSNHDANAAIALTQRHLTVFPDLVLRASSLTVLRLDHNLLTEIPMEIGLLSQLSQLSLSHNLLRAVCPAVSNLSSLVSLNLSHNRLTHLPHFLGWIPSLTDLDVRDNPGNLLPPDAPDSPSLVPEFLRQHSFSRAHAFQMKLFFVGTKASGKTLLMKNLANPTAHDPVSSPKKLNQLRGAGSMFSRASLPVKSKDDHDAPFSSSSPSSPSSPSSLSSSYATSPASDPNLGTFMTSGHSSSIPSSSSSPSSPSSSSSSLTPNSPNASSPSSAASLEPGVGWINKVSWDFSPSAAVNSTNLDQNLRLLGPKKSKTAHSSMLAPVIRFNACDFSTEQHVSQPLFFYFSPRSLYVVVFDLTKEDEIRRIDYWLSLITHLAPQEPIILVGTHSENRRCTRQYIDDLFLNLQDRLLNRFHHISYFHAISNQTLKGISELQHKLYEIAHARILRESPVPIAFFALREKIAWSRFQDRLDKKSALISLDDFRHLSSSVNLTRYFFYFFLIYEYF